MPAMRVGGIHHTLPAALTYSWLLPLLNATFGQKPAKLPLIPRKPFIAAWNVPLDMCSIKYNVTANIDPLFHIKGSPRVSWTGQNVTIFYANRLGYYPHYSPQGNAINGGVPQNCSLDMHLFKVYQDILHFIPAQDFRGLAVIDWEFWRPQWSRNWHKKEIYRRKSKELTLKAYLNVTAAQVETLAKRRFEKSARAFMQRTIQLGTRLRPNGLWGFYLYPDCHNYNLHEQDYTGLCPLLERLRNDELAWLWNSSTALFPSVAFRKMHTDSISNLHFSQHRIREALRIASMTAKDYDLPTYVYLRLAYRDDAMAFLTTKDLIHTIGESAALGAAGFVIWGDLNLTSSQHNCTEVKSYLSRRLGRYITNVTRAAEVCSSFLCGGHGRCVRRDPCAGHYLHLSARDHQILPAGDGGFSVSGWPSQQELQLLASRFHCHCYQGHQGPRCISSNRVREQEDSRGGEEEDTQRRRAEWEREQAGQTERANSSAGPSARRGGFILWVIFNLVFMKCCDHFST